MAHRVSADEGKEGVFSPDGTHIAYSRGPGLWYRKGYRGSANDDVWVCDADGSHNRQLTNFDGQDASPMWSADGKWIYYVSEFYGTPANIVRMPSTPVGNADASHGDGHAAAADHLPQGRRRSPRPHQRQRRVDRLRVRRRPVDGFDEGRRRPRASWPSRSTPTTRSIPNVRKPSRATPPSSSWRPTRSTPSSPSTASCS